MEEHWDGCLTITIEIVNYNDEQNEDATVSSSSSVTSRPDRTTSTTSRTTAKPTATFTTTTRTETTTTTTTTKRTTTKASDYNDNDYAPNNNGVIDYTPATVRPAAPANTDYYSGSDIVTDYNDTNYDNDDDD